MAAHRALGCRDLSRADFVVDEPPAGERPRVTLLEVNTMPGFTDTSLYPEAAGVAGIPMAELCDRFVQAAVEARRPAAKPRAPTAALSFAGAKIASWVAISALAELRRCEGVAHSRLPQPVWTESEVRPKLRNGGVVLA